MVGADDEKDRVCGEQGQALPGAVPVKSGKAQAAKQRET